MDYNKVTIVGRVTANPELRTTSSGQPVTTVGVATNRSWTDGKGEKQEETEFHTVVIFGRTAEVASQFLSKGRTVLFEGRLHTREWDDKQGVKHKVTEIMCESMQLGPSPAVQPKAEPEAARSVARPAEPQEPIKPYREPITADSEDTGRDMKNMAEAF